MLFSVGRIPLRMLIVTPLLASLAGAIGCADALTFAARSREQGVRLYNENAHADAAGAFRNAIRQDPRDYQSHYYLGVCYDQMGQHQQAFAQYRTALEVMAQTLAGRDDPEFRALVLDTFAGSIASHDARETELNGAEARAHDRQKPEDWLLVGKVYRLKGDADKAIDAYRSAANCDSRGFAIRKEFGLYLLNNLNQRQDAEYYLRQAYRLNPMDEEVSGGLRQLGINPGPA